MQAYFGISFTCLWVFEFLGMGIERRTIYIHRKFWHLRLIEPEKSNFIPLGIP